LSSVQAKRRKIQKPIRSGRQQTPSARPDMRTLLLAIGLVLVVLALYLPVGHHPFVNFDDGGYVINNPQIKSGLDWNTIAWAFTTFYQANWHPLTWLSHALDFQMFGLEPAGHHIVNLLLHLLNVVLLFTVLWRATGFAGRSLMVAALFALHPINVESVAWIAERKNLLSMFFFLLALEAYRRYVLGPRAGRYMLVAILFILGLMAKPQVITFPFVLLLWDYWPLRRMFAVEERPGSKPAAGIPAKNISFLLKEKVPLFVICAASAAITVTAQHAGGAMKEVFQHPFFVRAGNAILSYARYLEKAFWPSRLAVFYPYPEGSLPLSQVLAAFALLALITALVVAARQRRYLAVGWFWFLGTLVPMIGLVQVGGQAMADRYAYLPLIGLFILVCWGVAELLQQRRVPATWMTAASVVVLVGLGVTTHRQLGYWSDNASLWTHTLRVTHRNYVAEDNLGGLLQDQGLPEEAMEHFRAAAAIYPADPTSNMEIAMYAQRHGSMQEVVERYKKLISVTADPKQRASMLSNQGIAYGALKDYEHAGESFQAAVNLDPSQDRAWMGLGVIAQKSGKLNQAIEDYSQSIKAHPADVVYVLLAMALEESERSGEAQTAMQSARALSKNIDDAQRIANGLLGH
jgi:protein O-mannosyl-transferase